MALKRERRELLNPATGEVEGELPVLAHQNAALREKWMFSHDKGYKRLAKQGLSGRDYDVLMIYLASLRYGHERDNYTQITQQEIADELEIPRQSVTRSTKKLLEKKILFEGEKIGSNNTYTLNAVFGWKGKIGERYYRFYEEHTQVLEEFDYVNAE